MSNREMTKIVNYTCESGQVLDSGEYNTAGQILVQHIVEMAQSPLLLELKQKSVKTILTMHLWQSFTEGI